jgi:hypothetical protein
MNYFPEDEEPSPASGTGENPTVPLPPKPPTP